MRANQIALIYMRARVFIGLARDPVGRFFKSARRVAGKHVRCGRVCIYVVVCVLYVYV